MLDNLWLSVVYTDSHHIAIAVEYEDETITVHELPFNNLTRRDALAESSEPSSPGGRWRTARS